MEFRAASERSASPLFSHPESFTRKERGFVLTIKNFEVIAA